MAPGRDRRSALRSENSKTVLLTLGRLPVALDLARGFKRAGWRVVVAESQAMSLCRMSSAVDVYAPAPSPKYARQAYLECLQNLIHEHQPSLVVPVSEETVSVAHLAADGSTPVFCSTPEKTLELHDKLAFNRLAAGIGMPVPESWPADEAGALAESSEPKVVKPRFAASGRGFRVVQNAADIPHDPTLMVQAFCDGEEVSGFAVAREGQVIASVVYRSLVNAGSVAVCFERLSNQTGIENWMQRFVQAVRHTGFIAFDFIVDDDGVPQAIECNPRATSGLHFLRGEELPAVIAGSSSTAPRLRAETKLVESYSCFTAMLGALGDCRRRRSAWSALRSSTDISWNARDPRPFLLMTVNSWPIIWSSLRHRISFAEAAVADIEWCDGPG